MAEGLASQWPLALGWLAYGAFHSLLAANGTKAFVARHWPGLSRHYRLAFNLVALLTALPLAWLHFSHRGAPLWAWQGAAFWIMNGLALLALLGIQQAAQAYDMTEFMGLKPPREGGRFTVSFWHRFVRHPWYFFSLILIWTRDMDEAMLVSALAVSAYFALGSMLEEKKLLTEFPESYRRYRERVPALLPLPWKFLGEAEARKLEAR